LICYLDSSALVKRYLTEPGSLQIREIIENAEALGTVVISRAEIVAALGKAVRLGALTREIAEEARRALQIDWRDFARIAVSEYLVDRASDLAWTYGLRGYDSVQLAAAVIWQDELGLPLTLATFDGQLWDAASRVGLGVYPADSPRIR
jgi:predicted nucleic acid-binding protein